MSSLPGPRSAAAQRARTDVHESSEAAFHALSVADNDVTNVSRRNFLRLVGAGAAVGMAGAPIVEMAESLVPGSSDIADAAAPIGQHDGIVVLIGLHGGNDGFNTLIPHADPAYYDQRPTIAVSPGSSLDLDGQVGLHPRLGNFKRFWDAGQLAVVEGVGSPFGSRSHFASMATWMRGGERDHGNTGWIGRWLEGHVGSQHDVFSVAEIGNRVPLHSIGHSVRGSAIPAREPVFGASRGRHDRRINEALRGLARPTGDPLYDAMASAMSDQLELAKTVAPVLSSRLPANAFAADLEAAARLINADLGFRVLTVHQDMFDHHSSQGPEHARSLGDLDAAIGRFQQTLDPRWASRVVIATYSEFGRTSFANDSGGTDHGGASVAFVLGQNVKGGRYGETTPLSGLDRWDRVEHSLDYRSYYASLLDGWLEPGASEAVGSFEDLKLFQRAPGIDADNNVALPANQLELQAVDPAEEVATPNATGPSQLVQVPPFALVDMRTGLGGVVDTIPAGVSLNVPVTGRGGIPTTGVAAVLVNVTISRVAGDVAVTVARDSNDAGVATSLAGVIRPVTSSMVVPVGADGSIQIRNGDAPCRIAVQATGYLVADGGLGMRTMSPRRVVDSRVGNGITSGVVRRIDRPEVSLDDLLVTNDEVAAVLLNVTVVNPRSVGSLEIGPAGAERQLGEVVSFTQGQTTSGTAVVALSKDRGIRLALNAAAADVVVDVHAVFVNGGDNVTPVNAIRVFDTRQGGRDEALPLGKFAPRQVDVIRGASVPRSATAALLHVAAMDATEPTFLTLWADGTQQPFTGHLHVGPLQKTSTLVVAEIGANGAIAVGSASGLVNVTVDVVGWVEPAPVVAPPPVVRPSNAGPR